MKSVDVSIPTRDEIHVWIDDGGICADWHDDIALLDSAERSRALRVLRRDVRARFVRSHATVRRVLAAYVGLAPEQLHFLTAPLGKPSLHPQTIARSARRCDLRFSLSHSGAATVVAVACGAEIGVDVEEQQCVADWEALSAETFSASERGMLDAQPDDEARDRAFNRIWVRKEAYAKAIGLGLAATLTDVTVLPVESTPATVIDRSRHSDGDALTTWQVHDCAMPSRYAAAVATTISNPMILTSTL